MNTEKTSLENESPAFLVGAVSTSYLLLSGEGNIDTEHQFCMELTTLEEANYHFDNFKRGQFKDTYLFIYEAKKIREE